MDTRKYLEILQSIRDAGIDDVAVLGNALQPSDVGADYLRGCVTYTWLEALRRFYTPQVVGEIGVRFGYSLLTLGREAHTVCGWDNCSYVASSLDVARMNIDERGGGPPDRRCQLILCDTQKISSLGVVGVFDLFHVDGDHTHSGALHDMRLAWAAVKPGGVILVDDYYSSHDVEAAVNLFAFERQLIVTVLPTFRGLAVMERMQ